MGSEMAIYFSYRGVEAPTWWETGWDDISPRSDAHFGGGLGRTRGRDKADQSRVGDFAKLVLSYGEPICGSLFYLLWLPSFRVLVFPWLLERPAMRR